ncbi:MAG: hypothetical protein K2X48_08730 [Chitinophagaceae bacterium]|nr:hypothetical protein [Chitinophagaceae bacterium]
MNHFFSCISFILLSASLSAQNLTGTWTGGNSQQFHKLVAIQKDSTLVGYIYEKSMGYCTADFKGAFITVQKRVKGEGVRFINRTIMHTLCRYDWKYIKTDNKEFLIGTAYLKGALAMGSKVSVQLSRVSEKTDTTEYMANWLNKRGDDIAALLPPFNKDSLFTETVSRNEKTDSSKLKEAAKRKIHEHNTLTVDSGLIRFTLYDNGTYDHDTVTIIHNGKLLLQKTEVSLQPFSFVISVNKEQPFHEIILFAENEGTVPPNTALLIIESKGTGYRLNLSSSLKTNEKVVVILKE